MIFSETAQQTSTPFAHSLLQDAVNHPELFLAYHLHPNTLAQPKLHDGVNPVLSIVLGKTSQDCPSSIELNLVSGV